jgi:hypothetical protein
LTIDKETLAMVSIVDSSLDLLGAVYVRITYLRSVSIR